MIVRLRIYNVLTTDLFGALHSDSDQYSLSTHFAVLHSLLFMRKEAFHQHTPLPPPPVTVCSCSWMYKSVPAIFVPVQVLQKVGDAVLAVSAPQLDRSIRCCNLQVEQNPETVHVVHEMLLCIMMAQEDFPHVCPHQRIHVICRSHMRILV
mmetsp:Transcript_14981/g.41501  ORF Transcript_14981/g.41501 Transcript_14981/m.41501 type:complete len:151 (-) Transcript_14981:377-829(-)